MFAGSREVRRAQCLGWALHEEHRRLSARRTEVEQRIEEARSELEAIERRATLIDALLAEESAAA